MKSRTGALQNPVAVREMFDRIAPRYDLMNHLMTGGRDIRWRRETACIAAKDDAQRVLDVATGTGDLALAISDRGVEEVVGIDFSESMIRAAQSKSNRRHNVKFQVGDALALPFAAGDFDACTMAFGLRNMHDYKAAITEAARILRPGGKFVCLELTPYQNPRLQQAFALYFSHVVPFIGGIVSGDRDAYLYLPHSVAAFPSAVELAALMRRCGLRNVRWKLFGMGTVAIHVAIRQPLIDAPIADRTRHE